MFEVGDLIMYKNSDMVTKRVKGAVYKIIATHEKFYSGEAYSFQLFMVDKKINDDPMMTIKDSRSGVHHYCVKVKSNTK